ncbi:hypothetical protein JTB14_018791 [Gonioctena quinquepunctata]|nr:hypothetical protein JTB14_018791 [Gonioctena quinquepunctata]
MTGSYVTNHFSGCFEFFAKLNGKHSENFKFVRTQFYRKVSRITEGDVTSQITIEKHKYQKVSIPKFYRKVPRFQQKGIIFVWPQKKRLYKCEEMTTFAWVLSHTLFWLYNMNLLPSGSVLPIEQPPWKYEPPLRKPENRDYIIEPDWESCDY